MSIQNRQPAGLPTGGQFTTGPRQEPAFALDDVSWGGEDPTFDPDDPHDAEAIGREMEAAAAGSQLPADLSGADRYELAALRGQVQERLDGARRTLDVAANTGDVPAAEQAERDMVAALADLNRVSEAALVGRMSRDVMTVEQREAFDGVFRHAYDFGVTNAGGLVLADLDEAEEFASYVAHQLTVQDFDVSSLHLPSMLKDFDRERAGVLAMRVADGPDEAAVVKDLASRAGARQPRGRRGRGVDVAGFAHRLHLVGFYVERSVDSAGVVHRLTGGRPTEPTQAGAA